MRIEEVGGVLVDSVREVFEVSIFIFPDECAAEEIGDSRLFGELISMIHISGDMSGIVAMTSPWKVGEALARNMLGNGEDPVGSGEVTDCAGEIVNIVAGGMKTRLAMEGLDVSLSMPTVASGDNVSMICRDYPGGVRVPFLVEGEGISFAFLGKKRAGQGFHEEGRAG